MGWILLLGGGRRKGKDEQEGEGEIFDVILMWCNGLGRCSVRIR